MSELDRVNISFNSNDRRIWTIDSSGYFSCKSYFEFLVDDSNDQFFNHYVSVWTSPILSQIFEIID